ncbi:alpha/beta hydrolase fold domain-containing protein [Noviherbaspirillum sp. ST9]|uniref:alpha/beta hydrolase fold domain-containing protein n=1 Tax=Noviherbaspirillum sp. ST9 TaxID=3401606 RepID=UPI003B58A59A
MSWQARVFSFILRQTFKRRLAAAKNAVQARALLNSGRFRTPGDVLVTPERLGGIDGEWVEPAHPSASTLLYLHGGGYFACSPRSHRAVTSFYAQQGFRVFAPDYRLAPEHPFPAALEDAEAVYAALIEHGTDPHHIVLSGDSAGGGLALALLLRIRERGLPMPAAAALFSPLTDLAATGASITANDARCAMFRGARIAIGAAFYLGGADPRTPLASPLYADLRGLPPLLIHVGADEVLRDDSIRIAERAQAAGIQVELRVWPEVPHVWQLFHRFIPEGRASLAQASRFLLAQAAGKGKREPDVDVAIIGSGFSGLGMAIKLKESGNNDFVILEKAQDIGGTWRENTYPGCACDVPSHMYSFSWERNPRWSRMFATQPEILAYLKHCVAKYGLAPHIRFGAEMREAVFDEANDLWDLHTVDGRRFTARTIVSAMGALHRPALPALPGIDNFRGVSFHSAEWRHDVDLTGKRVAVIGTGASAIQFVPQIAPKVAQLTLFQRTPAWVLPKLDRPIGRLEQTIYRSVPGAMRLFRNILYWRQEFFGLGFVHPKLMEQAQRMALRHMERHIADPALRAKLTPSYTIGCKRILISNDYFPALARPNVDVVTSGITRVREHSIVGGDGVEYPVDAIIYGTGFRVTEQLSPVRLIGRNGVDINEAWRDGPQAHLGLMSAGFPNLFMLLGPNTGLGHNSVVFMAEQQIRHAMDCLRLMRAQGKTRIEVQAGAQRQFNEDLQRRLTTTVWSTGCKSWYLDEHGRNVTLWPGFTFEYWHRMRRLNLADYRFSGSV